jgi:hypothetical protein
MSSGRLGKLLEQATRRGRAPSDFLGRSPALGSCGFIGRTAVFLRNQSQAVDTAFASPDLHSFTAKSRRHEEHERSASNVNPCCSSRSGVIAFHATPPTYAINLFCATTTLEHGAGE